ncbi:MAG: extracellular solute-binding protein, partial [Alphaproteobacteria bacterium]|nr:extracellular solute-binding protein [Alphaproteobacteria bacterium]
GLVAESVDVAPDRSWIEFHLNPKARFHDGVPMTAEDVKWSFEALRKYGLPVRRRVYGLVKSVQILSPHDIKFTFGKGYDREDVMILALLPVLPEHYWVKHDFSATTLDPPLGSGPYKIVSVEPGRKIVYKRVKNYWAKDLPVNRGLYNFDTITYTYYRDDGVALQAFKAGDYNLRREYSVQKWVTGYDCSRLRDGEIVKEEIPHHRPDWLRAMIFNTRRPMFRDRRVREALGLVFDFDWIDRVYFYGKVRRIASVYPNSALAASGKPQGQELALLEKYKNDLPPQVFGDPWQAPQGDMRAREAKAMALLQQAGWVYRDERLVNAKTGAPFSFQIMLNDPSDEKIALAYARDLARIGIAAHVRKVDAVQFTGRLNDYDYDMVIWRWINSLSPGNEQVAYWSSGAAKMRGGRNYAGIENPAIDALAESIGSSKTYTGLLARAHALDRAIMWGDYMIPLYFMGDDMVAHDADLRRPEKTPIYGIVLESWWMQPQKDNEH